METNKSRSTSAIFGLGYDLTVEDGILTGVRFPTCWQVLRYLMWHVQKEVGQRSSVVSVVTRLNISPAQKAALIKLVIEKSGGDISCISKSYSTADKARRSTTNAIVKEIPENWNAHVFVTLHWDTKPLPTLKNKNIVQGRLPILIGIASEITLLGGVILKEMVRLCKVVLTGEDIPKEELYKQGDMHQARWMSKILYSIKKCLLEEQISLNGNAATSYQQYKLKDFVVFVAFVYWGWWLTAQSACLAPGSDLCMY
ncbi:unnamed protein product [Lepeophtheirus salmonis]|uniref:(salmon louse) hypothetical protein n=1 Tax=Lepeophtheirus salmonis TaxID=72036 RepID=A0A7R8HBX3_LEPSM|nr:unnamed protein product [Lepeophtheirus salmonis]CAF2995792.1 unnamed protein product [Lepeophtheirus salmonis]